jgi:hypothetical protein
MLSPEADDSYELKSIELSSSITRRLSKEVARRLSLDSRRRSYQVFNLIFSVRPDIGNTIFMQPD